MRAVSRWLILLFIPVFSMQPRAIIILGLAFSTIILPVLAGTHSTLPISPYAGQQARPIKALSDETIAALRKGEGMRMAKAAQLNGYPDPADELGLPERQLQQLTTTYDRMNAAAKLLGGGLITRE
jgi:hypothetical protein